MELLDAAIALVITVAALATTVTVLMEIWIRVFGLKSQGQVRLFQKIFDEAVKDRFPGSQNQWEFVEAVLKNPLRKGEIREPREGDWVPFIGSRSQGVYEWVSHEHVYRRLLGMQDLVNESRADLIARLERFTRKYDELCAAASAEFKDNRRLWSIIGGLLLAITINADGVRIFNEYMKRPELAAAMTARLDELQKAAEQAEERLTKVAEDPSQGTIEDIEDRVAEMKAGIAALETAGLPIGWTYPPHCLFLDAPHQGEKDNAQRDEQTGAGGTSPTADNPAVTGGPTTGATAAPPNACRLQEDRDPGAVNTLGSIFAVLGTGVLIGLGAPFWFDMARRLSEVRKVLGGSGGSEAAYSGETANKPTENKDKFAVARQLVTRVVDDALTGDQAGGARRLLVPRRDS